MLLVVAGATSSNGAGAVNTSVVDTTVVDSQPPTSDPAASGTFAEAQCPGELPAGATVTCGFVTVPEDHDDPSGTQIQLAVAVLPVAQPSGCPQARMMRC